MIRCCLFLALWLVASVFIGGAWGEDSAPDFDGRYVGSGYVYDEQGRLAKTDLRMDIRTRGDGNFSIEMGYFRDAVAKFAAVKADGPHRLVVDEDVGGVSGGARATGQIVTEDGSDLAGSIEVRTTGGKQKTLRTIKFHVRRLIEKAPKK